MKSCGTKRVSDVWVSAALSSIFLALSFSCYQVESTPAHMRVTNIVDRFGISVQGGAVLCAAHEDALGKLQHADRQHPAEHGAGEEE